MPSASHHPVLLAQVVAALAPRANGVYVDGTLGLGGHARALLEHPNSCRLIGFEIDPQALALAREHLAPFGERAVLVQRSYWQLAETLRELGIDSIDGMLLDLGVSSLQLDTPERGFSFRFDAPLDMRFGTEGPTAAELVATMSEEELIRVLREYGEESRARAIARAIVRTRQTTPIATTGTLRMLVHSVLRHSSGRIDPATRTFQALRIATNRELDGIAPTIERATELLRIGGRLAVISFHSLEDRIVKQTLRRLSGRCSCPPARPICDCGAIKKVEILTKRPLTAEESEVALNPRARSARLRVAERVAARRAP
jgi:16S rRNA (cytosine1402-N4)-methyltransferase